MKKAAKILNIVAVTLTVLFFAYSAIIGGDAFNGIDAPALADNYIFGKYYVANHGVYTQVSYFKWILSFIITAAFWMSLIAALVINLIAMFKKP